MNVSQWRDFAPELSPHEGAPTTGALQAWMSQTATDAADVSLAATCLADAWRALFEMDEEARVLACAVWVRTGDDGRLELLGRAGEFDDEDAPDNQAAVVASEQAWPPGAFWIVQGDGAPRDLALQLGLLSEQVAAPSLCVPMGDEGLALLWMDSEDGELSAAWKAPLEACARHGQSLLSFALRLERMNASLHGLAEAVADALDEREPHREGRSRAVAYYAALIAREMGLPEEEIAQIEFAALWHALGRLSVPESVLNADSALSEEQLALVRASSGWGAAETAKRGRDAADCARGAPPKRTLRREWHARRLGGERDSHRRAGVGGRVALCGDDRTPRRPGGRFRLWAARWKMSRRRRAGHSTPKSSAPFCGQWGGASNAKRGRREGEGENRTATISPSPSLLFSPSGSAGSDTMESSLIRVLPACLTQPLPSGWDASDEEYVFETMPGVDVLDAIVLALPTTEPDILLLDADSELGDVFAVAAKALEARPTMAVVLLSTDNSPDRLRRAMLAGAEEYLIRPLEAPALRESLLGIAKHRTLRVVVRDEQKSAEAGEVVGGLVVGVMSGKGGLGKTTLAVNLAAVCSLAPGKSAGVLALESGDGAVMLSLQPKLGLLDLAGSMEERRRGRGRKH